MSSPFDLRPKDPMTPLPKRDFQAPWFQNKMIDLNVLVEHEFFGKYAMRPERIQGGFPVMLQPTAPCEYGDRTLEM